MLKNSLGTARSKTASGDQIVSVLQIREIFSKKNIVQLTGNV